MVLFARFSISEDRFQIEKKLQNSKSAMKEYCVAHFGEMTCFANFKYCLFLAIFYMKIRDKA